MRGKAASIWFNWGQGATDDREGGGDRFSHAEDADLEPSLGAPDWTLNGGGRDQTRWALGDGHDLELATEDSERTLGWRESDSLTGRLGLGSDDAEETSEDEGAQCDDEGVEDGREPADEDGRPEWRGPVHHVELTGAAATYWAVPRVSG